MLIFYITGVETIKIRHKKKIIKDKLILRFKIYAKNSQYKRLN